MSKKELQEINKELKILFKNKDKLDEEIRKFINRKNELKDKIDSDYI